MDPAFAVQPLQITETTSANGQTAEISGQVIQSMGMQQGFFIPMDLQPTGPPPHHLINLRCPSCRPYNCLTRSYIPPTSPTKPARKRTSSPRGYFFPSGNRAGAAVSDPVYPYVYRFGEPAVRQYRGILSGAGLSGGSAGGDPVFSGADFFERSYLHYDTPTLPKRAQGGNPGALHRKHDPVNRMLIRLFLEAFELLSGLDYHQQLLFFLFFLGFPVILLHAHAHNPFEQQFEIRRGRKMELTSS